MNSGIWPAEPADVIEFTKFGITRSRDHQRKTFLLQNTDECGTLPRRP